HTEDGRVVIRAFRPDATGVVALVGPEEQPERVKLEQVPPAGLFEGTLDGTTPPSAYRLEVGYPSGTFTIDDPYRYWPTIGEVGQYLLGEGRPEGPGQKAGGGQRT